MGCPRVEFAVLNVTEYVEATLGPRCTEDWLILPTLTIYGVLFVLGLVGNLCTCAVIIMDKVLHTPTNMYLFSLAVSDIVIMSLGLPMELYEVMDYQYPYHFGEFVCKLRAFLIEFTSYASVLTICAFSVERWIAICFPLRTQCLSSMARAIWTIVITWMISFIAALPMGGIVGVSKLSLPDQFNNQPWTHLVSSDGYYIDNTEVCRMDPAREETQKTLIYFAFFVFFMLPAGLITVMYGHIAWKLRRADGWRPEMNRVQKNRSKHVLRVLVSVVVSFFLCWLPFHVQRLLSVFLNDRGGGSPTVLFIFSTVYYISGYCYYSNSACNPILYNILSANYREAFCRTILGEKFSKKMKTTDSRVTRDASKCSYRPGSACSRSVSKQPLKDVVETEKTSSIVTKEFLDVKPDHV